MTKKRIIIVCTLVLMFTVINKVYSQKGILGQDKTRNVITTAVPSLLIGPDSRMGAMGEVGVAVEKDINAQHWNPSKYVFSENPFGIGFSFSPWLAGLGLNDIYLAYLVGYAKVSKMDAISFSLRFFSMGDMEFTDYNGDRIGNFAPREFALDGAYSRILVDNLSMAVSGRFTFSKLANIVQGGGSQDDIKPGTAGSVDVSLFYTKDLKATKVESSKITWGLCISNIGSKVSYTNSNNFKNFLPANFRTGIAYTVGIDKYNKLTLAFDLNKLLVPTPPLYERDTVNGGYFIAKGRDPVKTSVPESLITSWFDAPGNPNKFNEEMQEFIQNFGLEYGYNDLFFIRTGFFNEAKTKGNRKYITFGVGVKYSMFAIDACYILPVSTRNHPLENTLRFSLTFDFGTEKKGNKNSVPQKPQKK